MLNLMGSVCKTGYGITTVNIGESLLKRGKNIRVHPIGRADTDIVSDRFIKAINDDVFFHKPYWPTIKIWHQHALLEHVGRGRYLGFPIFELDTFTDVEKANLTVPDDIVVTSGWAKDVVEEQLPGRRNVHIVPLGVNSDIFHVKERPRLGDYTFFTIGKLEYRKGHDFIVKCFNKAFEKDDYVHLNMMISNPFLSREITEKWLNQFKNTRLGYKINFYNPVDTHEEVADFINQNDCGVFPSRAEGWNLELLESMACGKSVITTNYSAHTEYCNHNNSFLIDTPDREKAFDKMGGMWFNGQGHWAELDYDQEEQMIEHMRYCYKNRPYNEEGVKTAERFSWDNSATKLLEIVNVKGPRVC